uniref:2',3'-cyclic nucleotide 3' phosphodiesterase n=1 Tax=Acanthochromis polyacanthus TaxID=80966 RepID=A0A3Q1GSH2_9TELE
MDTEKSSEVSDTVMEKEAALKEATPENPPAAEEEPSQSTVNGLNSGGPETGNVTPPEEKPEAKGDDSSAKEAHESSEKISDPVETPENTKQPPVPENEPEPLAKSSPEPEPEKSAESVPEAEPREQTSPEPAAVQQPVDSQPPSQEDAEKGPETTMEPKTEAAAAPKEAEVVKSKRGLQEAQLEAMKAPLEEVDLPLFFGWFLLSSVQEKVRCTSMDFLKTLDTLEAFKKHLVDFTGKAENEVDLEQYFKPTGALHCTTKFCNYGKAEGAKEYAENPAVRALYGSAFELSLTALFVTPRTVGARVSLTDEQLKLWPADAEQSSAASLPPGSRAHITLGCAEGVEPVQTGVDLLEILALQQDGQQGEPAEEMELGSLTYYGEGRWLLNLREPIGAPACFSSFYGRKESEPAKKEPEKKKKPKCAIL